MATSFSVGLQCCLSGHCRISDPEDPAHFVLFSFFVCLCSGCPGTHAVKEASLELSLFYIFLPIERQ